MILEANFPMTSDGRVYHLDVKQGDLSPIILTVGDPERAKELSKLLTVTFSSTSKVIKTFSKRMREVSIFILVFIRKFKYLSFQSAWAIQ
jgi:uridine phosphorylase